MLLLLFFFNDTATTEIYTLSLLDALPIFPENTATFHSRPDHCRCSERSSSRTVEKSPSESYEPAGNSELRPLQFTRSEEHTSELQSRLHIVCRLLLEKKTRIVLVQPVRLT